MKDTEILEQMYPALQNHKFFPSKNLLQWAILIACGVFIMFIIFGCILTAFGETIPPANLWKGLIGEAVSEGYNGMYSVACVYRNRIEKNMNLGCVALKRKDLDKFVKRQGVLYENMAKEIVHKVFGNPWQDVTGGATHYENIERYGKPYWTKSMIKTCKIGEHTFYKLAKEK